MSQSKSFLKTSLIPLGLAISSSLIVVAGLLWGFSLIYPLARFSDKCNIRLGTAFVSKSFSDPDISLHPIAEASVLLDTAPLFVPGSWNVAGSMLIQTLESVSPPPSVFGEYSPKIQLDTELLSVSDGELLGVEDSVLQPVRTRFRPIDEFTGLGQRGPSVSTGLTIDICNLRFFHLESGSVWERTIPIRPDALAEGHLWEPLIYYAAFGPLGFVGVPSTVNTSGLEKLDQELARLVFESSQTLPLPVGHYRIIAGP